MRTYTTRRRLRVMCVDGGRISWEPQSSSSKGAREARCYFRTGIAHTHHPLHYYPPPPPHSLCNEGRERATRLADKGRFVSARRLIVTLAGSQ